MLTGVVVCCILVAGSTCEVEGLVLEERFSIPSDASSFIVNAFVPYGPEGSIFVAQKDQVLRSGPGGGLRPFATVPEEVTLLLQTFGASAPLLVAITRDGNGFYLSPRGAASRCLSNARCSWRSIAWTALPWYEKKPHAVAAIGGKPFAVRLGKILDPKEGEGKVWEFEERLAMLPFEPAAIAFSEAFENPRLLALAPDGMVHQIDPAGATRLFAGSPSLAGASAMAIDRIGIAGGGILLAKKGELWQIGPEGKLKRIAVVEAAPVRQIATGPTGTIHAWCGSRVWTLGPPAGSEFAISASTAIEAEGAFAGGEHERARSLARQAAKLPHLPGFWTARLKALERSAEGMAAVAELDRRLSAKAYLGGLKQARALAATYAGTRAIRAAETLLKRCELASGSIPLADFEDEEIRDPAIGTAAIAPRGSRVQRAIAPDPVAEGAYSLRWDLPGEGVERMLEIAAPLGKADGYGNLSGSFWSLAAGYPLTIQVVNPKGRALATYEIVLRKAWTHFSQPLFRPDPDDLVPPGGVPGVGVPLGRRRGPGAQGPIDDFTVSRILIKAEGVKKSVLARRNAVYLDDLRVFRRGKSP